MFKIHAESDLFSPSQAESKKKKHHLLSGSLQWPPDWPPCLYPGPLESILETAARVVLSIQKSEPAPPLLRAWQGPALHSEWKTSLYNGLQGPPWPGTPLHSDTSPIALHCARCFLNTPRIPYSLCLPIPSAWNALPHVKAWLLPSLPSTYVLECHLLNKSSHDHLLHKWILSPHSHSSTPGPLYCALWFLFSIEPITF